jgi:hypothetical protein
LASDSGTRSATAIRIHITDLVIRTTDITGRIDMDMLGRHSIGRTDTAFIIGITDPTGTGGKRRKPESQNRRVERSPVLLFR